MLMPSTATRGASYEALLYPEWIAIACITHGGDFPTIRITCLMVRNCSFPLRHAQRKQFHNAARFIRASTVTWQETWLQQSRIDRMRLSCGPHAKDQPPPKCGPNSSESAEAPG